jgi:hypothetical protein
MPASLCILGEHLATRHICCQSPTGANIAGHYCSEASPTLRRNYYHTDILFLFYHAALLSGRCSCLLLQELSLLLLTLLCRNCLASPRLGLVNNLFVFEIWTDLDLGEGTAAGFFPAATPFLTTCWALCLWLWRGSRNDGKVVLCFHYLFATRYDSLDVLYETRQSQKECGLFKGPPYAKKPW